MAVSRIKREFKEVIKSEEVCMIFYCLTVLGGYSEGTCRVWVKIFDPGLNDLAGILFVSWAQRQCSRFGFEGLFNELPDVRKWVSGVG